MKKQSEAAELALERFTAKKVPRVFGAANIKRVLQRQKGDPTRDAHTSIAGKDHANNREQQRRLRREAKRNAK